MLHCCKMYAVDNKTLQHDCDSEEKPFLPELYLY
jgi:hypothetical protein